MGKSDRLCYQTDIGLSCPGNCNQTDHRLYSHRHNTPLLQVTDLNQGKLINWTEISKATVDLADPDVEKVVYDFETALVRYKYPLVDVMKDPNDPSKSITIEAIPTLIFDQDSDYDKDTLYDLELGVRQQLKCWTGVDQSPFAP